MTIANCQKVNMIFIIFIQIKYNVWNNKISFLNYKKGNPIIVKPKEILSF